MIRNKFNRLSLFRKKLERLEPYLGDYDLNRWGLAGPFRLFLKGPSFSLTVGLGLSHDEQLDQISARHLHHQQLFEEAKENQSRSLNSII